MLKTTDKIWIQITFRWQRKKKTKKGWIKLCKF